MSNYDDILENIRSAKTTPEELAKGGPNMIAETVSVETAGEILGVSKFTIYAAVKNGQIPAIRIGRRVLIPVRQLTAMLAGEKAEDSMS